jgi:hypothetical protein
MNPLLQILENRGLVSSDSVERFFNDWTFSDVRKVQEELDAALDQDAGSVQCVSAIGDPFNFIASASMRGDFGCVNWECRLQKTGLLARYAALYADKTVVPLPLGILTEDEFNVRHLLSGTMLCIQQLRPLVEAGIVDFARQEFPYCK